eukprot:2402704-Amphidinium_carterae.5
MRSASVLKVAALGGGCTDAQSSGCSSDQFQDRPIESNLEPLGFGTVGLHNDISCEHCVTFIEKKLDAHSPLPRLVNDVALRSRRPCAGSASPDVRLTPQPSGQFLGAVSPPGAVPGNMARGALHLHDELVKCLIQEIVKPRAVSKDVVEEESVSSLRMQQ